jgi:hypothetical protein
MPTISRSSRLGAAFVAIAALTYGTIPASGTDVVAEWSTIQMPQAPTPVTVDPKSTALFLLLLSESAFREAYAAWHMAGGGPPVTTKWVTVTRSDMITSFENANR